MIVCRLTLRSTGRGGKCLLLGEHLVGAPLTFNVTRQDAASRVVPILMCEMDFPVASVLLD